MAQRTSRRAKGVQRERVKQLRKDSTWPERRLWALLRNRRLSGAKFRRQQVIGQYIVDYYCAKSKLVIEVDGESHVGRGDADAKRDAFLNAHGVQVLRVTNDDVLKDADAVLEAILQRLATRHVHAPSPRPSPSAVRRDPLDRCQPRERETCPTCAYPIGK